MMGKNENREFTKEELLYLIKTVRAQFQKTFIRNGEQSVSIFFYNTNNSTNTYINISNKLIANYQINLQEFLKDA